MNLIPVIPAKAGIQLIEESTHSVAIPGFVRYAGRLFVLDSRLRGNDEAEGG
jgi:hypothetical protein